MTAQHLYGMHDPGGEHLFADKPGWIVFTEEIGHDPNDKTGRDYRQWSDAGHGVLVRLNNGYGSAGTIPPPDKHMDFARRVGHFAAASQGCSRWIIGNEPNHSQEWPNGQMITSAMYSDCFNRCAAELYDRIETPHEALLAGVAPWNAQAGDWLVYFADILARTIGFADGFALHTYTHGDSPQLITSKDIMDDEPFRGRWYQFYAYRDFMTTVPEKQRGMLVYITETDQDNPWTDANTGWVQAAYAEIDRWNKTDGTQKISCLCLYRWPKHDQWSIVDKPGVHADLRAAVGHGYQSPPIGSKQVTQTHLPKIDSPVTNPVEPALPRQISDDFKKRVPTIELVQPQAGQRGYQLIEAGYYPDGATRFGPDHHILVEVLGTDGKRKMGETVNFMYADGIVPKVTDKTSGPYAVDYGMTQAGHAWGVSVGNVPVWSDYVFGMGLGKIGSEHMGEHVTYFLKFQEVVAPVATQPTPTPAPPPQHPEGPTPAPDTLFVSATAGLNLRDAPITGKVLAKLPFGSQVNVIAPDSDNPTWFKVRYQDVEGYVYSNYLGSDKPTPAPEQPQPVASGDKWQRSLAFTLRWEGLWADDPNDPGGATMKGITLGTYIKWRETHGQPKPTKDDLRAISDAEVETIFREWYWLPSSADTLPWPMCLAVFDLAVNGGVGRAKEAFAAVGHNNFLAYQAWRLDWYTRISGWKHFGSAWTRRVADLMREGSQ